MDFYEIETNPIRGQMGFMEVAPWFRNVNSRDIMLRDGDFVDIWNPNTGLWSKNEFDVVDLCRELARSKHDSQILCIRKGWGLETVPTVD